VVCSKYWRNYLPVKQDMAQNLQVSKFSQLEALAAIDIYINKKNESLTTNSPIIIWHSYDEPNL
jgi:hypothetical protein